MNSKDYYEILGVSRSATSEEIRRAYRKRARKYHPDVNKSAKAETKFKELNEANEVLKDREKRKQYDMYGENWRYAAENHGGSQGDYQYYHHENNFHNTYGDNNGYSTDNSGQFDDFFNNIFNNNYSKPDRFDRASNGGVFNGNQTYSAEITLHIHELFDNTAKKISFITNTLNSQGRSEARERTINVRIPRGVTDGSTIRLPDIEKGRGQFNAVDLLLTVAIAENETFKVKKYDLHTTVYLAPWEAALGDNVAVKTIDGYVTLTIPPGTLSGKRFRLRGKGLPQKNSDNGDIIAEIVIQVPQSLSDEEKRLFTELSQKSDFDPRRQGSPATA